ncbi:MAG: transposase [Natronosporangium sp.]
MDVAELTYLLADWLAACGWPPEMRIFARRRALAAGEQPTLFAANGYKFSAFATNTTGLGHQLQDARHRQHARVEDDVRTTKATGMDHFPSKFWQANLGWAQAICIGVDLLAWLKLLGDLPPKLRRAEPETLRHRLLHTPARITSGQRHRRLRLPAHWPWSAVLAHAINTITRLPLPAPA